jgi:long-chain fatty acid transport protein
MRHALILILAVSLPAQASPLELYGIGIKGPGRGLANVAGADDLFAVFYNPAGLMDVSAIEFAIIHQLNAPLLDISLSKGADSAFLAAEPEAYQNTSLGFAVPLTGRLTKRAALGAVLEVPNGVLVRARSLDTRRPHWLFFDSYPDVFVAQIALALRVFEGFNLAVGLHNSTGLDGQVTLELDPTSNTWTQRELDFEFTGKMGPTVGLKLHRDSVHFGLVYRSPLAMDFASPASLSIRGLDAEMTLQLRGITHVLPHVLASGLEWRGENLRLELALQWKDWSEYPDPAMIAGLDVGGDDVDALGLGSALDAPDEAYQPRQSPGFSDTVSVGLGGSYSFASAWRTHFGYTFVPTPVPDQVHQTNLVDAHRHQITTRQTLKVLGAGDPVGDWTASGGVLSLNTGITGRL